MVKNLKNLIILIIVIATVSIGGYFIYKNNTNNVEGGTTQGNLLSPQAAAEKAINFINQNLLSGGVTASIIEVVEDNGLYKLELKVLEEEHTSYVTKDGKILFIQGIDMDNPIESESPEPEKLTCEDIKKTEKPLLEAFVVSKCPFGIQMQRILNEIAKNIPSLAKNIEVKYMGSVQGDNITAMHGEPEAQENLRQICIREEQLDKYWNYIDCHIEKGDIENCLVKAGVDRNKLDTCMSDNSKGLEYAKEDFDSEKKYKVTGSPALILNGERVEEFDFGGRTAEAVKTLLCCGFDIESDICFQKLTETSAATGFSETYSQSSGSSGGSCE